MIVSRKVRIIPDKEQLEWLKQNVGVSRFIYNYSLGRKIEDYKNYGISLGQKELMREITDMKYTSEYSWLLDYNSETIKQAVKDMLTAFKLFFKRGNTGFPKFKKKGKCNESFYLRYDRLYSIGKRHIQFPSYKKPFKVSEDTMIEKGSVKNPRVSFDGKFWYLSYSYEIQEQLQSNSDVVLGIDLGIESLATVSDGSIYRNINKDSNVIKLEKRKKILQRKISRAYEKNRIGNKYIKTNNIKKMEQKVRLIDRKLTNIRNTYIHQVTSDLVKTKPKTIVIEDLAISNMLKNKYLSKSIKDAKWYFFRQCLEYKCKHNGVSLVVADRYYPSTKLCSKCKSKKKFISLGTRIFKCDYCGYIENRDLNAAYNLVNYADLVS